MTDHTDEPVLYIVIPAYNEQDNLPALIEEWYPIIEKHNGNGLSRLVIVNDGSKDDSEKILLQLAKDREYLIPLTKPNGGHGSAVLFGYNYAIKNGADLIFQTDADRQTLPEEFEGFWNKRNKYDALIGMRKKRGDGASRKFVEDVLLLILWIVFGVKMPDSNAPFRLMKRSLLEKYIRKLPEDFNLPNVMLTTYFVYYKENTAFRNITFRPRQHGKNSINIKRICSIGVRAIRDFYRLKGEMKNDR